MRFANILRLAATAGLGATLMTAAGLAVPAQARVADPGADCIAANPTGVASAARGGASGLDHRGISAAEERAIARRTNSRLAAKGAPAVSGGNTSLVAIRVPVYFHVMRNAAGRGNVSNRQITRQMAVLNRAYAQSGVSFNLVSTRRYKNTAWHQDHQTAHYRTVTRKGGKNALNIWLVDFTYLGVSTFPWDYSTKGAIDGIRVDYKSLPGGSITNFNLGETATHEAGHWLGLFHTFQNGCTSTNDQISDTPAQAGPTSGCPASRDSCPMPGDDPVHNYMDYSIDRCYSEFTQGQNDRIQKMWTAWRA